MDREEPEVIEQQMQETRAAISEKVATLEEQVMGTLQSAQETVHETVHTVKEAVRDTLDVTRHIRDNPWTAVGGAVAVGAIVGLLVPRSHPRPPVPIDIQPAYAPPPPPREPRRPSWLDDLMDLAGQEIKKLGAAAIASATASLRQNIDSGIPRLIDDVLDRDPAKAR